MMTCACVVNATRNANALASTIPTHRRADARAKHARQNVQWLSARPHARVDGIRPRINVTSGIRV